MKTKQQELKKRRIKTKKKKTNGSISTKFINPWERFSE